MRSQAQEGEFSNESNGDQNDDAAENDIARLRELLEFTKQHKEIEHLGEYVQAQIDKWS